jgi:hypothetical protein
MIVRTNHLNQEWFFSSLINCLICSQGSHNHFSDSIENSALPIHIVRSHFFRSLTFLLGISVTFDSFIFDTLEVLVTDTLIVFH